jgi:hypothetical protein
MQLLDLPVEILVAIVGQLLADDELAAALACRRLREAVAATERRAAGAQLSTGIGAVFGSMGKLEWAVTSCGLPLLSGLLVHAARGGQLEQLSWLCACGIAWAPCDWDGEDPCAAAAGNGHLAVLQWARANGCPWDIFTCRAAIRGGHLAVLQWLRANGCSWDERACAYAAEGGHLAVLQWLRANGCPWNSQVCSWAGRNGHKAVLDWARANKCPDGPED